jgi:hypothetical protein
MDPENEQTLTIACRTKKNLEYIYRKRAEGEDVEEFTQLLNSMLSMVICLREDYYKGSHITWQELERRGLLRENTRLQSITGKKATRPSPKLQQVNSFSQLIGKLRNAFAHNCFKLIVNGHTRQITGITVWNVPSGQDNIPSNREWEADILETDLKELAYLFVGYIEHELNARCTD